MLQNEPMQGWGFYLLVSSIVPTHTLLSRLSSPARSIWKLLRMKSSCSITSRTHQIHITSVGITFNSWTGSNSNLMMGSQLHQDDPCHRLLACLVSGLSF